jgi:hypothetical protein
VRSSATLSTLGAMFMRQSKSRPPRRFNSG